MGMYTMSLNEVLEHVFNDSFDAEEFELQYGEFEYNGVKYGRLPILPDPSKIGLGTYPIFNDAYRPILNGKIVDNFFNREIAMESVDVWMLAIRRKMDQVMPFYNDLYKSMEIEFDPLVTMKISSKSKTDVESEEKANTVGESTSKTTSNSRAVNSETPQTMLSGNGDYASGATDSNGKSEVDAGTNQQSEAESKTKNVSENDVVGYQAVASDLLMRYRSSIINVDTMVINELEDCFFGLLSVGDSYIRNGWYY